MLPAHVPFYKRRLFWGFVFSSFFVVSTALCIDTFLNFGSSHQRTLYDVYSYVTISYAATLFRFIIFDWLNGYGEYIGSSIYFILMVLFAYKTFQNPRVSLPYPIIFSIIYITGLITTVLFIGIS
jgi:hypothetical protein